MVNITGLNKGKVLKALWENSKAQGMSYFSLPQSGGITEVQCQEQLDFSSYVDYFAGRVIKVDLGKDSFDPALYDRDNGEGAAQQAVDKLSLLASV